MEDKKIQILTKSLELFKVYGIKSVSMDDISSQMGMSKKTLYNFFKDKKELVSEVLNYDFDLISQRAESTFVIQENAVDQILALIDFMQEVHATHSHTMVFDLQKYFPEEFRDMQLKRRERFFNFHNINIQLGISQGIYRENLDIKMVPKIIILLSEKVMDNDLFTYDEVCDPNFIKELMQYHLHGIVNDKGFKYLNKRLTKK